MGGQLGGLYFRLRSKNNVAFHSGGQGTPGQPSQVVSSLPRAGASETCGRAPAPRLLARPGTTGSRQKRTKAGDRRRGRGAKGPSVELGMASRALPVLPAGPGALESVLGAAGFQDPSAELLEAALPGLGLRLPLPALPEEGGSQSFPSLPACLAQTPTRQPCGVSGADSEGPSPGLGPRAARQVSPPLELLPGLGGDTLPRTAGQGRALWTVSHGLLVPEARSTARPHPCLNVSSS